MCKIDIQNFNWDEIQKYYQEVQQQVLVLKKYNISRTILNRAKKVGKFIVKKFKRKHSQQTKQLLSQIRKKYLSQNPQNHVWKKNTKFISPPCEYLKQFLTSNNICFIPQYNNYDQWKHNYSIDIAFPNQKIGIQINGEMHYQRNGQLKKYYQKRHQIIESFGWKIYQFHYSLVYKEFFKQNILKMLKQNIDLNFDFQNYVKQKIMLKQLKVTCPICGGKKLKESITCRKCRFDNSKQKVKQIKTNLKKVKQINQCVNQKIRIRQEKQIKEQQKQLQKIKKQQEKQIKEKYQLQQLVKQHSLEQIGRMYNLSGNAIKKRCLKYNIDYKQYTSAIQSKIAHKIMIQKNKYKHTCPVCDGYKKSTTSKTCRKCYELNRQKKSK